MKASLYLEKRTLFLTKNLPSNVIGNPSPFKIDFPVFAFRAWIWRCGSLVFPELPILAIASPDLTSDPTWLVMLPFRR
jgi:hypothetical protein